MSEHLQTNQATRFSINGTAMTGLDFLLFTLIGTVLQWPPVGINVLSTGLTSLLSYRINKNWVFQGQQPHSDRRMLLLFIAVTMSGLFIIQNVVIFFVTNEGWGVGGMLRDMLEDWGLGDYSRAAVLLGLAKTMAVVASSIWNFFFYRYVVFKR